LPMTPPEDARWVSKQTFLELWEAHQKALTKLHQAEEALAQADKMVGWLCSEVLRLGDLAREYSRKNDLLRQALKTSTNSQGE